MCMLKSGLILKDRVYVPDHDHHTQMLEELKIEDSRKNASSLFVRAELLPPNGDVFAPIEGWKFKVDQDIVPDWFVSEYEKTRIVEAVKAWAAEHIFTGLDDLEIKTAGTVYLKRCKRATLRENSTATLWENSTGILPNDYFHGKKENYVLMENSSLKDCNTKTMYQSGDWKFVVVGRE